MNRAAVQRPYQTEWAADVMFLNPVPRRAVPRVRPPGVPALQEPEIRLLLHPDSATAAPADIRQLMAA